MKAFQTLISSFSITLITIIPSFKRKYLSQPKLKVQIVPGQNYSKKKWTTGKTSSAGLPLFVYESCWNYEIIIENPSSFDAYYPKIKFDRVLPYSSQLSILNPSEPIKSLERISLTGNYTKLWQDEEKDVAIPLGISDDFKKIRIILEYQNEQKTKFYTVFDIGTMTNTLSRTKSSEFYSI